MLARLDRGISAKVDGFLQCFFGIVQLTALIVDPAKCIQEAREVWVLGRGLNGAGSQRERLIEFYTALGKMPGQCVPSVRVVGATLKAATKDLLRLIELALALISSRQ